MSSPYLAHLKSSKDLETSYEAVRAGFVALALEKNRRATPYVAEARALKASTSNASKPADLLTIPGIQPALLTAAGISDKAANHLREEDKLEAINGLIETFLEPAGPTGFIEELIFRFLLTRGDTLGGSMRNIAGSMAQKKLSRAIIAQLRMSGRSCQWTRQGTDSWAALPEDDTDIETNLRGLSWEVETEPRTLIYNLTIPFLHNNVDFCLLKCEPSHLKDAQKNPLLYLALGELKGGIDPAGADEHWKTARTALERITQAFTDLKPHTFFIGAAIEPKMATEIWDLLKTGWLSNAANLTNDDHISFVTRWLCGL